MGARGRPPALYGPEPPSEELLKQMLALPPSDRTELAEIMGAKASEMKGRERRHRRRRP